jgi:hypothetical protein
MQQNADSLQGLSAFRALSPQEPARQYTSAFVTLFEHTRVNGLTEAIRKGGGVVFNGGMITHNALAHVSAELAAAKKDQDA